MTKESCDFSIGLNNCVGTWTTCGYICCNDVGPFSIFDFSQKLLICFVFFLFWKNTADFFSRFPNYMKFWATHW